MKKKILVAAVFVFVLLAVFSVAESAFMFLRLSDPPKSFWRFYFEGYKTLLPLLLGVWVVLTLLVFVLTDFGVRKNKDYAESVQSPYGGIGFKALDGVRQGVLVLEQGTKIGFINKSAAELLGHDGSERTSYLTGLDFETILSEKKETAVIRTIAAKRYEFGFDFLSKDVIVIITDITEESELKRIKDGLIDAANSEFIAPLAAISSYAGLIKGGMSEENMKNAASVISAESKKLSAFVKNLLSNSESPN